MLGYAGSEGSSESSSESRSGGCGMLNAGYWQRLTAYLTRG